MFDINLCLIRKNMVDSLIATDIYSTEVLKILTDDSFSFRTLYQLINDSQQRIIDTLGYNTESASSIAEAIDIDYMLLALCLLKVGRRAEAVQTCTDYYAFIGGTDKFSVVFKTILLHPSQPISDAADAPNVSIVVPLYNQGRFLGEAIPSILNQTHLNIEIIIVDDGSTDDSLQTARDLILAYPDRRITILTHPNKGKGFTRNRGVSESTGKYVCILDADDMLASTYLEEAVGLLEANPETGWITPLTLQFGQRPPDILSFRV
jgi:hypothetical protein